MHNAPSGGRFEEGSYILTARLQNSFANVSQIVHAPASERVFLRSGTIRESSAMIGSIFCGRNLRSPLFGRLGERRLTNPAIPCNARLDRQNPLSRTRKLGYSQASMLE
jgi:hypothetical protein